MIFSDFLNACQELTTAKTSFAVVTMIQIDAHVPQEVGAKMLVTAQGLYAGTVGGGKLEARCIALGIEHLADKENASTKRAHTHRIDLNKDLGMVCGGVATVLIEVMKQQGWTIALYGAGHVGQALASALAPLHCEVLCFDIRKEWLDKMPERPRLQKILTDDMSKIPATLPEHTYHVIATQGHAFDLAIVREVLKLKAPPYIGVIGSKVKARNVRASLMAEGFSEAEANKFHCPMGLPIGNNTPAEIAISIIAQMLETRDS